MQTQGTPRATVLTSLGYMNILDDPEVGGRITVCGKCGASPIVRGKDRACAGCKKASNRLSYHNNIVKRRAYRKAYALANPEKVRERKRAWKRNNREKHLASRRRYYAGHSEQMNASTMAW